MKRTALWLLLPAMGVAVAVLWLICKLDRDWKQLCNGDCTPDCGRRDGCV